MASCLQLFMKVVGPSHHHTQAVFNTLMEWLENGPVLGQHEAQGSSRMPGAWVE
jgi:hypothetical protein